MVAWIRDSSNLGALIPAWGNVCYLPRARAPLGRDAAWLRGFVIAVIREPYLRGYAMSVVSIRIDRAERSWYWDSARSPISRARAWGLSSRPDGPPDPVATGDVP